MPAVYEPLLMLHRGMPFGEVLRMTLLGNHERMSAARALEIGLVSEVVADADALAEAGRLGRRRHRLGPARCHAGHACARCGPGASSAASRPWPWATRSCTSA